MNGPERFGNAAPLCWSGHFYLKLACTAVGVEIHGVYTRGATKTLPLVRTEFFIWVSLFSVSIFCMHYLKVDGQLCNYVILPKAASFFVTVFTRFRDGLLGTTNDCC